MQFLKHGSLQNYGGPFPRGLFSVTTDQFKTGRISPLSTVLSCIPESLQLQKFNDYTYLHISLAI